MTQFGSNDSRLRVDPIVHPSIVGMVGRTPIPKKLAGMYIID